MTEPEARAVIIHWARGYFAPEMDDPLPEVEVLSIVYNEQEDEWTTVLQVSTSADNPTVTFWVDEGHLLEKHRVHIENIEY
jgi:hypothetical protein